jgi:hypothetical protein
MLLVFANMDVKECNFELPNCSVEPAYKRLQYIKSYRFQSRSYLVPELGH